MMQRPWADAGMADQTGSLVEDVADGELWNAPCRLQHGSGEGVSIGSPICRQYYWLSGEAPPFKFAESATLGEDEFRLGGLHNSHCASRNGKHSGSREAESRAGETCVG